MTTINLGNGGVYSMGTTSPIAPTRANALRVVLAITKAWFCRLTVAGTTIFRFSPARLTTENLRSGRSVTTMEPRAWKQN